MFPRIPALWPLWIEGKAWRQGAALLLRVRGTSHQPTASDPHKLTIIPDNPSTPACPKGSTVESPLEIPRTPGTLLLFNAPHSLERLSQDWKLRQRTCPGAMEQPSTQPLAPTPYWGRCGQGGEAPSFVPQDILTQRLRRGLNREEPGRQSVQDCYSGNKPEMAA